MGTHRSLNAPVLQIDAASEVNPETLVLRLSACILACNGWILRPPATAGPFPTLEFEFDAVFCLQMYAGLVQSGLHLGKTSHIRLTHAWMCARHRKPAATPAIVTVELRMHLLPTAVHALASPQPGGPAQ
jgi:hypothetical protein